MTEVQRSTAARQFVADWKGKGYEKGQSQTFWLMLLEKVFGVDEPDKFIKFEDQVHLDHTSFIDGFIHKTHVLIEQKSIDKNLRAPIRQSDGTMLNPFQQAKRYAAELPYSERPRWIVCCNFKSFLIYDMEQPNGEPEEVLLENLEKEHYRLAFMVNVGNEHIRKEIEVSMKAGEIIGKIYDKLVVQYRNPSTYETLHSLNMLCVRLVFCLYAEDAGILGHRQIFSDYLRPIEPRNIRRALIDLFRVLNQKPEQRSPYLEEELAQFPYVNGGLFAEEDTSIPQFTGELKDLLCRHASDDFDWSEISPTIFGAIFESTLNPETRRTGGMHYTSIENIHKVIDPLFLNDLHKEFDTISEIRQAKIRNGKLLEFQNKLGSLIFLDPACGSGNFLTEAFISLRRLENDCLRLRFGDSGILGMFDDDIHVHIDQFYGIEINGFARTVAKTALWIAENQMMEATEQILQRNLEFLPLKTYANIVEGDALTLDWHYVIDDDQSRPIIYAERTTLHIIPELHEPLLHYEDVDLHTKKIISPDEDDKPFKPVQYDYIMGNPPFVGARLMSAAQKHNLVNVFGANWGNVGNLDFVCAWYKKASDYIRGTKTRCAFVSTNSICQGEQVAGLWKPLFAGGLHIDFAYRTFRWDSEATQKAHVHCVIVGFSYGNSNRNPILIDEGGLAKTVKSINAYLVEGPDVFIENRNHPICNVPHIGIGNKPIDGGNYLFTEEEKEAFVKVEPKSAQYFHPFYGAKEFIKNNKRFCLWLGDCTPAELRSMPHCLKRAQKVRELRLKSKSADTVKLADKPTRFHVENMPRTNYIAIPETSSERRRYTPLGFLTPNEMCSNAMRLIPDATLYHFGILTSNVHMSWMRAVCGRLKSDYRYSKNIVYNNFPWPHPTQEQQSKIGQTAQSILDARALYPDSSLADLYDEVTMPAELRRAHQENDRAVMQAYGFPVRKEFTESQCVACLFEMYTQVMLIKC